MKTISKPAALLLALTLALSLMACGDNGGAPDDGGADGDVPSGGDYTALAGDWYLDGDPAAESILSIAADGSWELYERPGGDGDPARLDGGNLREGEEAGVYYADSTDFDGVTYDMQAVDEDVLYWGGEYDCYQRGQ